MRAAQISQRTQAAYKNGAAAYGRGRSGLVADQENCCDHSVKRHNPNPHRDGVNIEIAAKAESGCLGFGELSAHEMNSFCDVVSN
jgi:hypothetical protein